MPLDPRLTALTTAAKQGLAKRRMGKGRQITQGFRRAPLNTNPNITPSRQPNAPPPPGQTPGLIGDTQETGPTGAPAGSSPALGMLTGHLAEGIAQKRKRARTGQQLETQ
jgi:hypothetical protein